MFGLTRLSKKASSSSSLPQLSPRARLNAGKLTMDDIWPDPVLLTSFKDYLIASLCQESLFCVQVGCLGVVGLLTSVSNL